MGKTGRWAAKRFGGAVAVGAAAFGAAFAAPAGADFNTSQYTYKECGGNAVDPVNWVWYGGSAYGSNAVAHTEHHTGWTNSSGSSQITYSHGYCRQMSGQRASGGSLSSRFHIRLFQTYHRDTKGRYETVGDAHHEDFIWYCGHAVDANGSNGSGFDQGKMRLFNHVYGTSHYYGANQYWGNTRNFKQCDGDYAGSNGYVLWFGIGWV